MHGVQVRLLVAACGMAATLGPGPAGPGQGQVGARDQAPRYRSGIEVVEVAFLARDSRGVSVTDLRATEVTVAEEGAPQEILALERVSLPAVGATTRPPAATPGRQGEAAPLSDREVRVFVFVLDALHVAAAGNLAVRRHAREFVEQYMGPRDVAAVLSPGAVADATVDFTSDRSRLIRAIDSFTGTKLPSATVDRRRGVPIATDEERAYRVEALADSLEKLARRLDRLPGRRKALLLFTEGFDYDTGDVMGREARYASEVRRAMNRAVGAVALTNTVLYAIDPRGLDSIDGQLLETPIIDPRDIFRLQREFGDSIRSLRALAEGTGGFLATDKGMERAYQLIAAENSDYYLLRYAPKKPARPGESRRISVRTSRAGVRITARSGYTVPRERQ
jgi:VWFA-related protein